jgi:hypothetical protein
MTKKRDRWLRREEESWVAEKRDMWVEVEISV